MKKLNEINGAQLETGDDNAGGNQPAGDAISNSAAKKPVKPRRRGKRSVKSEQATADNEGPSEPAGDTNPALEGSQPTAGLLFPVSDATKANLERMLSMAAHAVAKQPTATFPAQPPSLDDWVERIARQVEKSARSLIELGKVFIEAKASLGHGDWQELFQHGKLRFSQRTAQRLMQIADNTTLANTTNSSYLPPSLDALMELARLDAEVIQTGIDGGAIGPAMTIAAAKKFAAGKLEPQAAPDAKPFMCDKVIKSLMKGLNRALEKVPGDQRKKFIDDLVTEINKVLA